MNRNQITRRYQLVRPLGEGGMGEVYLVEDLWENNRQVALKKLRREALSSITRESFAREFTALKQLRHPNLSSVYDFGYTSQGDPFFTSEYCVGSDYISSTSRMGFGERLERAVELCRALSYIHARGYIHSDLKPENILILSDARPGEPHVKVLDFGLSHHINEQAHQRLGGTLAYLAPEIIKGRKLDARADLYSLGVVLYQLFTRQLPFGDIAPPLLIDMQLSVTPSPPTERDGTLPVAMNDILLRLLAKDPAARYQRAEEVIQTLNQTLGYQFEIETHATAKDYVRSGRFVGRASELSRLRENLDGILGGGNGRLILVGGESGVGKTRLLEEFKTQAQLEGVRTFTGAAYEKIGQPLQAFVGILRPMFLGAEQPSSPQHNLMEKYNATLGQLLPHLFGTKSTGTTPPPASSGERELLLESLAMFVVEACAGQPTLILIQDIHWGDALSLELIARMARVLRAHPLILAASFRSDELRGTPLENLMPALSEMEATEVISLEPLGHQEVSELVNSMLGVEHAPRNIVDRIVRNTQGNPFFIQEVLWSWIEESIIQPHEEDHPIDLTSLDSLQVPQTMTDAFLRRIGHLSEPLRELLETLSLFSQPASLAAICWVTGKIGSALEAQLDSLVESAILVRTLSEDVAYYGFKHIQMKHSIESGIDPSMARPLHLSIGEYYESEAAASLTDFSEILSYHFSAAGEPKKARFYLIRVGDRLRRLFAFEEAILAYQKAEIYTEPDDNRMLEIREKIGFCTYQQGLYAEAEKIFVGLINDSTHKLTASRKAKLHLRLGTISQHQGNYEKAIEILNKGLTFIETLDEPKTKADILARIGDVYHRLSNYPVALSYVSRALSLVEHLEDYFGLGDIYNHLFVIYYFLGDYGEALRVGHHAIAIYSKFGWLKGVAGMTANLGAIFEDHLANYIKAMAYQKRALHLREKIMDRRGIEQSYLNLASIHTRIGQYTTALGYLDQSAELNKAMPERHLEMLIANHRGENWTFVGDLMQARAALDEALSLSLNSHNQQVRISTLNRISAWHEKLGEWEEAFKCSSSAFTLALEVKSKLEGFCTTVSLARIEMSRGNMDQAAHFLEKAMATANDMNHVEGKAVVNVLQAKLAYKQNALDQARTIIDNVKDIVDNLESPIVKAYYYLTRGKIVFRQEDRFRHFGADDFIHANKFAETTEDLDLIAQVKYALAEWHSQQADRQNAIRHYQQAAIIVNSIADRLPLEIRKKYLDREDRYLILKSFNAYAGEISSRSDETDMTGLQVETHSNTRQNYFLTLFQISKIVNSLLNMNELLERVMDLVLDAIRVERGLILLVSEESGDLEVKVARNIEKETIEDATAISKTVLEEVLRGGKPLISVNAHDDERLRDRHSIVDFGIGMVLCIPLTVKEKIIGAVYIDNPIATLPFGEEDVNFLMSFTNLFAIAIENARLYEKIHQENIYLKQEIRGKYTYENIIGRSSKMQELYRRLDSVVNSSANVIIAGESGTGKELIARAIHYNGSRKEKRFVAIDCGAIPENLIESELFGYRKGAFTGAMFDKKGLFEEADGGTIFLDEITNTSRTLQAKLLRVVQEREIRRVGDSVDRKVDVRIIAATNRDLKQMVQSGEFREDLYFRLNVLNLVIPPLRERKEDIPLLANHILKELVKRNPSTVRTLSHDSLQSLIHYDFPGNVRELENLIESSYYMAQGNEIRSEDFPPELSGTQDRLRINLSKGPYETHHSPKAARPHASEGAGQDVLVQALGLFNIMKDNDLSFWKVVKEPFMRRELSKEVVREILKLGLEKSHGRYKDLLPDFHIDAKDYIIFMNFLRKHDCQVDYRPFRKTIADQN